MVTGDSLVALRSFDSERFRKLQVDGKAVFRRQGCVSSILVWREAVWRLTEQAFPHVLAVL